jgi:hypothetical protein
LVTVHSRCADPKMGTSRPSLRVITRTICSGTCR